MHAFNSKGVIRKYNSPNEILTEYCKIRLDLYEKRRVKIMETLKSRIPYHENVVRFIQQQCLDKPKPDLRRRTAEDCDILLNDEKFMQIDESFNYLLNLPIASLTLKHAHKHENDLTELRKSISEMENTNARVMWFNELSSLNI